ncbi:hypothetical protein ACG7TL_006115 [Trametes sanguinea]
MTQNLSRGQKRKVEYDDETSQDPQVSQALAQTQSLAGLKFKKVKTSHPVATTAATTATLPKSQYNVTARKRKNSEREDDSSEEEGALSDSSEDVPLAKRCKTTHPATHGPSRPAWKYGARRTQSGAGSVQRTSPLERTARRSPAPALGRRVPSIARLASKGVGAARKISDELRRRMKGFDERLASHTQTFQRRLTVKLPFSVGKARAPVHPEVAVQGIPAVKGSRVGECGMVETLEGIVGAGGVRGGL